MLNILWFLNGNHGMVIVSKDGVKYIYCVNYAHIFNQMQKLKVNCCSKFTEFEKIKLCSKRKWYMKSMIICLLNLLILWSDRSISGNWKMSTQTRLIVQQKILMTQCSFIDSSRYKINSVQQWLFSWLFHWPLTPFLRNKSNQIKNCFRIGLEWTPNESATAVMSL